LVFNAYSVALQAISIFSLLTNSSWTDSKWVHPFRRHTNGDVEEGAVDNRANMRRLIEESSGQGEYHDEPEETPARALEAPPGNGQYNGPRVEPSSLVDTGNEWRDEGDNRES
jgi:hypothetical protein